MVLCFINFFLIVTFLKGIWIYLPHSSCFLLAKLKWGHQSTCITRKRRCGFLFDASGYRFGFPYVWCYFSKAFDLSTIFCFLSIGLLTPLYSQLSRCICYSGFLYKLVLVLSELSIILAFRIISCYHIYSP